MHMITNADAFDTSDTPIGGNPFDIAEFNPAMSGSDTVLMRQRPENTFGDLDSEVAAHFGLTRMSAGATTPQQYASMTAGFSREAVMKAFNEDRGAIIEAIKRSDGNKVQRVLSGERRNNGGHKIVDGKIVE